MDDSSDDEEDAASAPVNPIQTDPMLQVPKNERVFIHHDKECGQYMLVRPSDFTTAAIPKIPDPELHILPPDAEGKVMIVVDSISKDPTTKSKYTSAILSAKRAVQATGEIYQRCLECL